MNDAEQRLRDTLRAERQALDARAVDARRTMVLDGSDRPDSHGGTHRGPQRLLAAVAAAAVVLAGFTAWSQLAGDDDTSTEVIIADQSDNGEGEPGVSETLVLPDPTPAEVLPTPIPTSTFNHDSSAAPQSAEPDSPQAAVDPTPAATPQPTATSDENSTVTESDVTPTPQPQIDTEPTGDDSEDVFPVPATEPTPLPIATLAPTATPLPTPTAVPTPTTAPTPTPEETVEIPPVSRSSSFAWVLTRTEPGLLQFFDGPGGEPSPARYTYPDGTQIAYPMDHATFFGTPSVVQVLRGEPGDEWVEVIVPVRPEGTTRWVSTDGWEWSSTTQRISISLSERTLRVFDAGALVLESAADVGNPSAPTPTSSMAYVDEILDIQVSHEGPAIISLTVFTEGNASNGALPKVAIQGIDSRPILGEARTSGAVLVPSDVVVLLADLIQVGAIVEITP